MNSLLQGVNLYLVGMMGAGKTIVGRLLATQLGYRFVDAVIEEVTKQSITQIFARFGEPAFRQLESQVLAQVCAYTNLAIATGYAARKLELPAPRPSSLAGRPS